MKTHKTVRIGISQVSTENHRVVTKDEWVAERRALLAQEKELTRQCDQIARERRALPWVRIDKNYGFDAPEGRRTLAELFEGRRQLLVQHFMLAPGWEQYGRGVEVMMGTYNMLDLTPKGRDERDVDNKMEWVRHHDRYELTTVAKAAPATGRVAKGTPRSAAPLPDECPHEQCTWPWPAVASHGYLKTRKF